MPMNPFVYRKLRQREAGLGSGYQTEGGYDDTDYAQKVWELLKEGKQDVKPKHHPDILAEAAKLVKSGALKGPEVDDSVPFSKASRRFKAACLRYSAEANA